MSRLRNFLLLAAVAALATAFAACGGGGDSSDEDPQKVIENATLEGVNSGNVEFTLGVNSTGEDGGDLDVSLSGPFQSEGKEDLPQLDLEVSATGKADGEDIDFEGGLTVLSDRAYVGYKGTEYEVDPTTFGFVKSAFEQAQEQGSQETGNVTACQEAAEGIKFSDFAENLANEGSVDVDGTSTTKVSGDLNPDGAIDALIQLTENPACAKQLESAGELPIDELEEAKGEVSSSVKKAHVDIYVGEDDIVRRAAAELTIDPPDSDGKIEIELDLILSGVNEEQEISAPSNARPLKELFSQLGVNPLELLEGVQGGDFEGLLEGLLEGDAPSGGAGSGGGSGGGGSSSGGDPQAFLECTQDAETTAELQKCASLAR